MSLVCHKDNHKVTYRGWRPTLYACLKSTSYFWCSPSLTPVASVSNWGRHVTPSLRACKCVSWSLWFCPFVVCLYLEVTLLCCTHLKLCLPRALEAVLWQSHSMSPVTLCAVRSAGSHECSHTSLLLFGICTDYFSISLCQALCILMFFTFLVNSL